MHTTYGVDASRLYKAFSKYQESTDPTLDLLLGLAIAERAAERMEDAGIETRINKRRSFLSEKLHILYREALYLRAHAPQEGLDLGLLSRFGRLQK